MSVFADRGCQVPAISHTPQQEVVNGWVARDLLTVLAKQTNAMLGSSQAAAGDPRIPLLLLLLVLAVSLIGATAPTAPSPEGPAEPGAGFAGGGALHTARPQPADANFTDKTADAPSEAHSTGPALPGSPPAG